MTTCRLETSTDRDILKYDCLYAMMSNNSNVFTTCTIIFRLYPALGFFPLTGHFSSERRHLTKRGKLFRFAV